ncbi:DUF2523 domain-containing protein [Wohlfahrtiimonas chitiniclastica]|uniref:DUF2523 domain-containing protein n=1 Tax=Wohlfahrtiimonas chitiniclastica TaxID=400946 RepID=UPI00035C44C4|nr:DUF2523 domain-containing protein [Wohlfahrtiimonas chitiniclastica]OYQ71461.1 hypothetical protein B9T13_01975 [Wohlfahrtiimonas chitiniclastica]
MQTFLQGILVWVLSSVVLRVFAGFGLGFFTYTQVDKYIEKAMNFMTQYLSELPTSLLQILRLAEVDTAISIVFSALLTTITIRAGMVVLGVKP